jgi:hypothetical protein
MSSNPIPLVPNPPAGFPIGMAKFSTIKNNSFLHNALPPLLALRRDGDSACQQEAAGCPRISCRPHMVSGTSYIDTSPGNHGSKES